jgi:anti-sigma factor RsiW
MALDDDLLQRYFDGDLPPDERRRVRAEVANDASAQKRLAELARLSELLREPFRNAAREVDADRMFANIERGIREQKARGFGERLRVITSEWTEHRKGVLVPTIASMAVAAAALVVLLSPRHARDLSARAPSQPSPPVAIAALVHGSSVENVDFGESTGTVFEVENEGVRAAVVWIADDEEAP